MYRPNRLLPPLLSVLVLALFSFLIPAGASAEIPSRHFCVWDPVGAGGPVVTMMNDAKPKSLAWGVNLELEAYTDDKIAANDFKAGKCDAVLVTEVTARQFNSFTGTLGAVGAIPGQRELKTVLSTLSAPKAAKLMREGRYEVAGIIPVGSVFIFVRDRAIDNIEKFQGKKMAVLDNDPVAVNMVRRVGGSVVGASLSNFAGYFNNGGVDIIFAPAVAYETLELYKGVGEEGGILTYPLLHTSMQILIAWEQFPEGFGQEMRRYVQSRFDEMVNMVQTAEAAIPQQYWVSIPAEKQDQYDEFMRDSRISLMNDGLYDARALKLMKKVRCHHEPTAGECVTSLE
ncbi:putative solute-binding protein [Hahella ganghwensis]|uniref:putative solute-binding protein n=1 Tax=Hahella ganghwensis TaxID=286420 RepID=UPI00036254FD|nr:putative solute-binding protein [Hahella ganghwensis]